MAEKYNIIHTTTPPYHAQANPVERMNKVLKTMISAYIDLDQRDWDKNLLDLQFAINTSWHSSTGFTPAFLNHGRELNPKNFSRKELEQPLQIDPQDPADWANRVKRIEILRDLVRKNLDEKKTKNL